MKAKDMQEGFEPANGNRLYPALFELHRNIQEFSKDLDDFTRLVDIQRKLISSIMQAESDIRKAKAEELDPAEWQYTRYNFLCLGDCLVFYILKGSR